MKTIPGISVVSALLMVLPVLNGCKKEADVETGPKPRPVTVLELREIDPVKPLQLTGSVKSWKEEDVAFEVEGRVDWIVEMGTNLEGRWVEDGEVELEGSILARLDPRPYIIRRNIARARVDVANRIIETATVQLEQVLPANLKAAEAERDRSEAEFERNKQAWETKAISEVDLIRARADRDAKLARYEQARATIETKKAEIESLQANLKEAQEELNDAQYDLDRCTLYAPMSGEVSAVYTEAGGYADKGKPVAHLVMMDPTKVDLAVSAESVERVKVGDPVRLFLPGKDEPATGTVYEKATIADPETRTFRISIITRNWRSTGDLPPDSPLIGYPRVTYLHLTPARWGDPSSPYLVEQNRALHQDATGDYVWADPDHKFGDRIDPAHPLVTLRKFYVTPGEQRMNLQGLYLMRELADTGELEPGTLIALDVPGDFKDGDQALVSRKKWLLRPGQLVPVLLGGQVPKPGLYVPMNTIKPSDEQSGAVFVLADGEARKVSVRISGNLGELFRIEAADAGQAGLLTTGAQVITEYIHFLRDGDPVQVVKKVELKP